MLPLKHSLLCRKVKSKVRIMVEKWGVSPNSGPKSCSTEASSDDMAFSPTGC